jgi:hypothetical protein
MTTLRWNPPDETTPQEELLLKTVKRTKKLFGFLRRHRRLLFDDAFQDELAAMYRGTGAGKSPHPPALMAMLLLLQAYTKTSDAEAVQKCVVDLRWQMVLDCLGATQAPVSQGSLHDFRQRLIEHDLDRRVLERTVEVAKATKGFDPKKLPKSLRIAADSRPLRGAGRVEDTLNLLGHAAREVVACVAALTESDIESVAKEAGIPLVLASSIKVALDTDWTDPKRKAAALQKLLKQLEQLLSYVQTELPREATSPPLQDSLETLRQVMQQDLEPDPNDPTGKQKRIRQGVAKDRRVSVTDADMRHGRKTRNKAFNGYKQHVAMELDMCLIVACALVGANRREHEAMPALKADLARYDSPVDEYHVDRGYTTAELDQQASDEGATVFSKPRRMPPNSGRFTKRDFKFNLRDHTVTCPAGEIRGFTPGAHVAFGDSCSACTLRERCTTATQGRVVQAANDELSQQRFLRLVTTKSGRAKLRERIYIEHALAHLAQKQGDRARYLGERKNLFDLRRTAAVLNLEVAQRALDEAA